MGLLDARESWRSIRGVRAELPPHIGDVLSREAARLETFHSALEQSQQQFEAAARIGYESRPLNLFYGLSQAGRALAAASARLGGLTESTWRASGHGLKFAAPLSVPLMQSSVRVVPSQRDLFSRVSEAVGSTQDLRMASLEELLSQIPDYWMEFQDSAAVEPPIGDLHFDSGTAFPSAHGIHVPGVNRSQALSGSEVLASVRRYPALGPLRLCLDDQGAPAWIGEDRLRFEIREDDVERTAGSVRLKGTVQYRRNDFLLPAMKDEVVLQPIPSWWLLLFALSVLARYAPDDWTRVMSLRRSAAASRIEFVLDAALDAVPELICEALESLQGA